MKKLYAASKEGIRPIKAIDAIALRGDGLPDVPSELKKDASFKKNAKRFVGVPISDSSSMYRDNEKKFYIGGAE